MNKGEYTGKVTRSIFSR